MSKTDTTAKNKNSMATFFKVLRFIGKYRFLLVLSVILAAVTVILQLYVPVLFGYAIDEVVAAHEVNFTRMGFYLSRILVMIVFSGIATWIMSVINNLPHSTGYPCKIHPPYPEASSVLPGRTQHR